MVDLKIGQRGAAARAPVDDTVTPIDKALVVVAHKGSQHRFCGAGVHGESFPRPVAGCAQHLVLVHDDVAILVHPLPHPLQEALPAQLLARLTLLGQLLLHNPLRRDARVVFSRQPECGFAAHAVPTHQRVGDGSDQRMAQVQLTGHVGRRHDDAEGLLAIVRAGSKPAALFPEA